VIELGYRFKDRNLLERALTHRSFGPEHNERMEFLGDSLLNCFVSKHLFDTYQDLPEGALSRMRANLVNQQSLAKLSKKLNLGTRLRVGDGEEKSGGRERPSILADTMEALFGAVWLDADFLTAQKVVLDIFIPYIKEVGVESLGKDAKTLLQEYMQAKQLPVPRYEIAEIQGLAHAQTFVVKCHIDVSGIHTSGEGSNRRMAEQEAAKAALSLLQIQASNG